MSEEQKQEEQQEPLAEFTPDQKLDLLAHHMMVVLQGLEVLHQRVSDIEQFLSEGEEESPTHGGH